MNRTKHSVIITIFATMEKGKSNYTKASVRSIGELLEKFHNAPVKRRWLFQCLADLEAAGLIRRKKRFKRYTDGTVEQLSSMISFTLMGAKYMVTKKVEGAQRLLQRIIDWFARKDGRFPAVDKIAEPFQPLDIAKNQRRLKKLIFDLA